MVEAIEIAVIGWIVATVGWVLVVYSSRKGIQAGYWREKYLSVKNELNALESNWGKRKK